MVSKNIAEAVNRLFQDLCDSRLAFGGKKIVFGGDFRQTLPVLPRKGRGEIVFNTI